MKIIVPTPNGNKLHGHLEDRVFTRHLRPNAIRQSDDSFCLHEEAMKFFQIFDCDLLKFSVNYDDRIEVYQIEYDKVKDRKCTMNEYGEWNLRIPRSECESTCTFFKKPEPVVEKKDPVQLTIL